MKNQIEEKVWELFDKHNIATHEDEGGVPCADEIAQYCAELLKQVAPSTDFSRRSVLEEATRCVCTDRNNQYGEPEDNFAAIARLWSEYLSVHINAHHVAIMEALFKIGRIMTGGAKADSYVDACGYLACAAEIAGKGKAE